MAGKNAINGGVGLLMAAASAAGIQIPPEAQTAISGAVGAVKDIASGKRVDAAIVDNTLSTATKMIPGLNPTEQKLLNRAVSTGIAVGHGQKLQGAIKDVVTDPGVLSTISNLGQNVVHDNPVLTHAASLLSEEGKAAFHTGIGVMQHTLGAGTLNTIRNTFESPIAKRGFDLALATHAGMVMAHPAETPEAGQAGYYATLGMRGAPENHKQSLMTVIVKDPVQRTGALVAVKQTANARMNWWEKLLHWLHIE
jgi:hypothetical protein